jgi:hypothetical protein
MRLKARDDPLRLLRAKTAQELKLPSFAHALLALL